MAEAQAQADANKLLEKSLTSKVIAYEQIQKWNGIMPKVTGSDNGMLVNIDLDDIESSSYTTPQYTEPQYTEPVAPSVDEPEQ